MSITPVSHVIYKYLLLNLNGFATIFFCFQETQCQLQNETQANNPSATAQRSVNMYYMTKLQLRSDNICLRPWAFERVPNKMIRGLDNALIYTSTKEACLAACLNEVSSVSMLLLYCEPKWKLTEICLIYEG